EPMAARAGRRAVAGRLAAGRTGPLAGVRQSRRDGGRARGLTAIGRARRAPRQHGLAGADSQGAEAGIVAAPPRAAAQEKERGSRKIKTPDPFSSPSWRLKCSRTLASFVQESRLGCAPKSRARSLEN